MGVAKKEAKRLEKETKLAAKAAKGPAGAEKKVKVDKVKKEGRDEVEFVNTTPKGGKKGTSFPNSYLRMSQLLHLIQTSRSQCHLATIPSLQSLHGTTGGRLKASSSLKYRVAFSTAARGRMIKESSSYLLLPRTSPEACTSGTR